MLQDRLGRRRLPVDHSVDHHPVLLRRLGRKQLRLRLQQQRLQQRLRLLNTRNRARGACAPRALSVRRTGAEGAVFYGKTPLFEKKIPIQAKTVLAFFGRWVYDNARNAARSGPSKGRRPEPCGHRRGLFQSGKDRSGFVVRGHSSAASSILFYAFGEGEKAAGQAR